MSTKELTKTAASNKKIENISLSFALKNGSPLVWASCLIMGLANFGAGQYVKGLIFLAIEAIYVMFMTAEFGGLHWLGLMPSLGDRATQEIWNDDLGIYEYIQGDNSQQILLYAVATLVATVEEWQTCSHHHRRYEGPAG